MFIEILCFHLICKKIFDSSFTHALERRTPTHWPCGHPPPLQWHFLLAIAMKTLMVDSLMDTSAVKVPDMKTL